MTEVTQVNDAVRHHLGPLGRFLRVEHAYASGWPDFYYVLRKFPGWLECKLIPRSGTAPRHLTIDQILWAEEEVRYGGSWHLLGLREPRTWVLYDAAGAREWFDKRGNHPLVEIDGRFPTKEIALTLIRGSKSADHP